MCKLLTNGIIKPVGTDYEAPVFSWEPITQKSEINVYRVVVSSDPEKLQAQIFDVFDSGELRDPKVFSVSYKGKPLESGKTYYWTVMAKSGTQKQTYESSCFTTGLMDRNFGKAVFISADKEKMNCDSSLIAPAVRKQAELDSTVESVSVYAACCGIYIFYLNGQQVSNCFFDSTRFEPSKYMAYQTFHINCSELKKGNNVFGFQLANGWFNFEGASSNYGKIPAIICLIKIKYKNGKEKTIYSDEDWESSLNGPIRANGFSHCTTFDKREKVYSNEFYYGESYDANYELDWFSDGWDKANRYNLNEIIDGYTVSEDYVSAVDCGAAVYNIREYDPVRTTKIDESITVFDFGQNMAGVVKITAKAPKGTVLKIEHSEDIIKQECEGRPGTVRNAFSGGRSGTDYYIFKGDRDGETFYPRFTYHGFRYAQVTDSSKFEITDVKAEQISSIKEITSTFQCSDKILNKWYENTCRSIESNFVSTITDCPTREKNGWMGDAQEFARMASFNADVYPSYNNFLKMARVSQRGNGKLPEIVPARWSFCFDKCPAGWADAGVLIPWDMYWQTGDKKWITENYRMMHDWVLIRELEYGETHICDDCCYGDHLNEEQYTEKDLLGTAFCAHSADLFSKMAKIVGNENDYNRFKEIAEKFKRAWQQNFLDETASKLKNPTQTGYVLGICFELFQKDKLEKAKHNLTLQFKEDGMTLKVGYLGMGYLMRALKKSGMEDLCYYLLTRTEYPSLLYPVTEGATTIWEMYNGGSLNHLVHGVPCESLFTMILGIEHHDEFAGYRRFYLEPSISKKLKFAKGGFHSAAGNIESGWQITEDGYNYSCTVPNSSTAILRLPIHKDSKVTINGKEIDADELAVNNGKTNLTLKNGNYHISVQKTEVQ